MQNCHAILGPFATSILQIHLVFMLLMLRDSKATSLIPLCLGTIWWHMGWVVVFSTNNHDHALLWAKITHIGILYLPVGLMWVVRGFCRVPKWHIAVGHLAYLFFLSLLCGTDRIIRDVKELWFGYYALAGDLHVLFLGFIGFSVVYSVIYCSRSIASNSGYERRHLQVLLFSLLVYSSASVDFLLNYGFSNSYPLGFIFSTAFFAIITYSILIIRLFRDAEIASELRNKILLEQHINLAQKGAMVNAIADAAQAIAHDVQTPFSAIQLILKTFKKNYEDDNKPIKHLLSQVEKNTQYAQDLLQDLVHQNHLTSIVAETHRLDEIIISVLDRFRAQHPEIAFEYSARPILAKIDRKQITRLFSNLIGNAINAMNASDKNVWIEVNQTTDQLQVTVGNNGSFVPEDQREAIFYKYHSRGKHGGTGLGLAICAKIVSNHGGVIFCRSDIKVGTEFVFTLPLLFK